MSLWTRSVIVLLLLLQTVQSQAQQTNDDSAPIPIEEEKAETSAVLPGRLVFTNKDWNLTQAYFDVFSILSDQNTCSRFYGGPRVATTVLNDLVALVEARPMVREISFQMAGRPTLFVHPDLGVRYRLFGTAMVNTKGSFYQRRPDPLHKFPSDVGNFGPGTRRARALILLHELGHLIEREDGNWLIPDDGRNGPQSTANTLRVQQVCYAQLRTLN
jgi:hypothetical protein